jgi:uncharacterized protein YbjT (DUF2867 family)
MVAPLAIGTKGPMTTKARVLLTGATGFVGTHIFPALFSQGFDVVCGTRDVGKATKKDPSRNYCRFDLADAGSVDKALVGVEAAIYLVHSMGDSGAYAEMEMSGAETFRTAAEKAGIKRIVYLGGMRPRGRVSHHLASRLRTGEILRGGSVSVVELQASMIVGSGSESFRIVRDLAARLPFMLLPKWIESASEPVAVRDVAAAIVHALEMPLSGSRAFAIPGPERLTGREIILRTAALLGHKPRVCEVPFVTPRLSSYWIRLVTRANPNIARELVEGLRSDVVATGPQLWTSMHGFTRTSFEAGVRAALEEEAGTLPITTRLVEGVLHQVTRADDSKQKDTENEGAAKAVDTPAS